MIFRTPGPWTWRPGRGQNGDAPDGEGLDRLHADTPAWRGTHLDPEWCLLEAELKSWQECSRHVDEAHQTANGALDRLADLAHQDGELGHAARAVLVRLGQSATELASFSRRAPLPPPPPRSGSQRRRTLKDWLGPKWDPAYVEPPRPWTRSPDDLSDARNHLRTSLAITALTSLVAASFFATGFFVGAALVLITRILLNRIVVTMQPPGLPNAEPGAKEARVSLRSIFSASLVLLAGDLAMLVGIAIHAATESATYWVLVTGFAATVTLIGALSRAAALAVGVRAPRYVTLERFAHVGGLALGAIAAIAEPNLVYIATSGFFGYGIAELVFTSTAVLRSKTTSIATIAVRPPDRGISVDEQVPEAVTNVAMPHDGLMDQ